MPKVEISSQVNLINNTNLKYALVSHEQKQKLKRSINAPNMLTIKKIRDFIHQFRNKFIFPQKLKKM